MKRRRSSFAGNCDRKSKNRVVNFMQPCSSGFREFFIGLRFWYLRLIN